MTASALAERLRKHRETVSPAEQTEPDDYTPTTPEDYEADLEAEREADVDEEEPEPEPEEEEADLDDDPEAVDEAVAGPMQAVVELVAQRQEPSRDGRLHYLAYDKAEHVTINIYAPASVVGSGEQLVVVIGR